jgi:putative endonuclease
LLGTTGETLVCNHLEQQGFVIVERNARIGRLEIDVIARRGSLLVFCEVRTRSSDAFVDPIDTIDRAKQLRIRRAAEVWLLRRRLEPGEIRFDAASVLCAGARRELNYYEDAF